MRSVEALLPGLVLSVPLHGDVVPTPMTPAPSPQATAWVVGDRFTRLAPVVPH